MENVTCAHEPFLLPKIPPQFEGQNYETALDGVVVMVIPTTTTTPFKIPPYDTL
jgi:hypothetical protein